VTGQAGYPDSVLCKFLDARLPQRKVIAQSWAERVRHALWPGIGVPGDHRRQVGRAIEIRIGLDLAEVPGYWDALSFLPPDECRALLRASALAVKPAAAARTLAPLTRCCGSGPGSRIL